MRVCVSKKFFQITVDTVPVADNVILPNLRSQFATYCITFFYGQNIKEVSWEPFDISSRVPRPASRFIVPCPVSQIPCPDFSAKAIQFKYFLYLSTPPDIFVLYAGMVNLAIKK